MIDCLRALVVAVVASYIQSFVRRLRDVTVQGLLISHFARATRGLDVAVSVLDVR